MKLLVTGGAGYLGSEVCRLAEERGFEVLAGRFRREPPHGRPVALDVRDADAVERLVMRLGPDAVIHTAYVQHGPEMHETIVRGSHAVAAAAHRAGARLLHLSTDLVFDGEQGAPYAEADEPRPIMAYGAAKLEAEQLVARVHPHATLVRTSLLYGQPGPQEALALRDGAELYTDEIRCPTRVEDLASALLELIPLEQAGPLHVAAPGAVSRYELARALRAAAGADPDGVRGVPSPRDGRARNVALDSSKAAEMLGRALRGVGRSA
ncbi:MAG TPA: sugar nucleotide-binding protein [Gaiellaceae bacterium]|nr:sugar nucleotide-binding protein [Gaiellaceae bacterium]